MTVIHHVLCQRFCDPPLAGSPVRGNPPAFPAPGPPRHGHWLRIPPERLAKRWGTWEPSAVNAIRSIRLSQQGPMAPTAEAELFAYGFATGECQRRLGLL